MKQEELKVGMEVWIKGVDLVRGKISEIANSLTFKGCFVVVDYDPSNTILGLNCYAEADEVVLYNPNEPPPEPYKPSGELIEMDEFFAQLGGES